MDLSSCQVIEAGPARFALLPERAVLNLDTGDLYIADLHLGKSTTFRARAIPIPDGDTRDDLDRLGQALRRSDARRLVVLGDFLHAEPSHLDKSWLTWRQSWASLPVTVVRGNHDVTAGTSGVDWGVTVVESLVEDGLDLRHEPEESDQGYVLSGHLHPAVRLRGAGPDRLRLPCFHVGRRVMVLPAFTRFSGGHTMRTRAGDRVFAIAEDVVLDVSELVRGRRG